jgi:membrane protein
MASIASVAKARAQKLLALLSRSYDTFDELDGFRLGAAFSYYATFAIFPLVLLTVTVVGYLVGDSDVVRERILLAVGSADTSVTDVLNQTLVSMKDGSARKTSAAIGLLSLAFAASGAFAELDFTLNKIWGVKPRVGTGIVGKVKVFLAERLSGLACVVGIAILLLLSLITSATLSVVAQHAPSGITPALLQAGELGASVVLLSVAMTAAFHYVPRSRPPVRDVLGGAVFTTLLLTLLKAIFALYVSRLTSFSTYGVAGGVLALATWIYLSSQLIFFGATVTRVRGDLSIGGDVANQREQAKSGNASVRATAE